MLHCWALVLWYPGAILNLAVAEIRNVQRTQSAGDAFAAKLRTIILS